jgi:UDP-N-acetylmuramate dehydrogenase
MSLLKGLGLRGAFLEDEPLCDHTTFRIGGPVKIWAEPADLDDLLTLLDICRTQRLSVFLIGGGSNLLVPDKALDMIAISLKGDFDLPPKIEKNGISCAAGYNLQRFVLDAIEAGYSGLEFMAGIPGTIGGAIKINAGGGLNGPWISNLITRVKVCDFTGNVRYIAGKELGFGYRKSNLKDLIILEADFLLSRANDREGSRNEYQRFLRDKKDKQELSIPSAGCVFKNPETLKLSAAQLIDGCGLKGKRIGNAMVSTRHANFIVNLGKTGFGDVMDLIGLIKNEVLRKYQARLETEIEILGKNGYA